MIAADIQLSSRLKVFGQALILGGLGVTASAVAIQLKVLIYSLYDLAMTQTKFHALNEGKKRNGE